MNSKIVSLLAFLCSCFVAKAETVTWTYSTGWDHGFVLTMDRETSSVSIRDGKTDKQRKTVLQNSDEVFKYFAALIRRVDADSVGSYADDGPENRIVLTDEKGKVEHKIFDVSPPHLFLHWKIQDPAFSAEDALKEADVFLKQVDAFLLISQLRVLKESYFEGNPNPFGEQDGADQPAAAPESKPKGEMKPQPESKVRPQ